MEAITRERLVEMITAMTDLLNVSYRINQLYNCPIPEMAAEQQAELEVALRDLKARSSDMLQRGLGLEG